MSNARNLANLLGTGTQITTADIADEAFQANKSLIINGAMQVAQRGTTATGGSTGLHYGGCDRWRVYQENTAVAYTLSQDSNSPNGFATSYKLDVTTADATLDAADRVDLIYRFEGNELQGLAKGTSDAKQMTLSFWVSSPKTGTHVIEFFDNDNTRSISKSYTVSAADTWEYKTIVIDADTTGALDNDTALSLQISFWLMAGSNFTSGTLATSWGSVTAANRAVGQVNVMDNTANNFYITGIQLELGETATPFEHRSYGDELARCQRYYYFHGQGTGSNSGDIGIGSYYDSVSLDVIVQFPVTMRATPTVDATSGTNYYVSFRNSGADYFNSFILNKGSPSAAAIGNSSQASGTGGQATLIRYNSASARVAFDSEL